MSQFKCFLSNVFGEDSLIQSMSDSVIYFLKVRLPYVLLNVSEHMRLRHEVVL